MPKDGTSVGPIDVVVAASEAARHPAFGWVPGTGIPWRGADEPVSGLTATTSPPVGAVRVLLSDLSQHGMIRILRHAEGAGRR